MKLVRFVLLGSAALMICVVQLPTKPVTNSDLMGWVSKLVINQAFADSSNGRDFSSKNKSSSGYSSKSGKSGSSGGSGGGSTDCLVCVPVSSISSSAYSTSSSSSSKSDDDNKSKSGSSSHKVSVCHSAGGSGHNVTLSIDASAVPAHLKQGDSYGSCSNTISTCAAMTSSGTVIGIWVPSSAVGDDTALNTYFSGIQSGTPSGLQACSTSNATRTYRDIRGQ